MYDDGVIINCDPTTIIAAEKNPVRVTNDPKEMPEKVKIMLARLDEIKMNDKSSLKRSEKKESSKRSSCY
ncbi:hypothetical protein [Flavobacterium sp. LB1P62]|uniref:hypothetical protein n=1 Tax=unclassified Flavobacterium TaxID=196869 RepID=UPI003AAC2125